jgi:type I restriction enzyme S subunit
MIPSEIVISDFEIIVSSLMTLEESNKIESRRLASLRDTLLPRLMSGELKVNDIENAS